MRTGDGVIALVSGATPTLLRHAHEGCWGRLVVPRSRDRLDELAGMSWAADNGAFTKFNPVAFTAMIDRDAEHHATCLFVASPDVFGDPGATREAFEEWEPQIRERGLPVAYVLQTGQAMDAVPWDRAEAVFFGGGNEFKYGPDGVALVLEAKRRGKWVHVGRVNSPLKIKRWQPLGVDSVDGTGLSRWPDREFKHWRNVLMHEQLGMEMA